MAETQPEASSVNKMTLGTALSGMWKLYTKKPFVFSGIYLLVMVPVTIINMLLLVYSSPFFMLSVMTGNLGAILSVAGILWLIYLIISIVAGVLTLGGVIRATDRLFSKKTVTIGESLSYAFSRIWAYIILALRVFWYSLAWILILFMILYPVVATAITGNGNVAENSTAYAQTMQDMQIDLEGLPQTEEEALEFLREQGVPEEVFQEGFEGDMPYAYGSPVMTMSPLYSIIVLILGIIVFIRALKAFFSFYILFDEESISTKDALDKSIQVTKSNLWRIIGYAIVIGLILGIASGIVNAVMGSILMSIINTMSTFSIVWVIWTVILGAVMYPLPIIYFFLFYKGLRKEKGIKEA
jgi:hypothetical protein